MTRNEQIMRAAANNPCLYTKRDMVAFAEGATWADRTMLDKATKLYRSELTLCVNLLNRVKAGAGDIIDIEKSVHQFRKALEQ